MQEELIFRIRAIADGLDQATKKAANEMRSLGGAYADMDKNALNAQKSVKSTNTSIEQTGAVAAAAVIGFRLIVGAIKEGIDAYNQYRSAMIGLQSVAAGTGNSMASLQKITDKLTKDGLMTAAQTSAAIKNLLLYGYTADQAADILDRLKDSAAYNRQSQYNLGDAVRVTTEGIRMENSVLSDAAGVQKNIAKMYEEYADSIGKSSNSLTQAEKAQAVYNGIMAETQIVVGNAAKYSEEFAGTQAQMEAATLRLKTAFGDATSGGLQPFISMLGGAAGALADFIENNRVLVSVLTTLVTVGISFIAMLGIKTAAIKLLGIAVMGTAGAFPTLGAAIKGIWVAMGPVGWVITAIGVLVSIISAIGAASEESRKRAEELRQEIEEMADSQKGAADLINEYQQLSNQAVKTADDTQRMLDIRAELVETYGFSVDAVDNEGRLLAGNLETMKEQLAVQKELLLIKMQENAKNEEQLFNNALSKRVSLLEQIEDFEKKIKDPSIVSGDQLWSESYTKGVTDAWQSEIDRWRKELAQGAKDAQTAATNMIKMMVYAIELNGREVPAALESSVIQKINDAMQNNISYDSAKGLAQGIFDRYFQIDSAVVIKNMTPQIQELKNSLIAAISVNEGADAKTTGDATNAIKNILNSMFGEAAQQEAFTRAEQLKQKILDGMATTGETDEYDQLTQLIANGFVNAQIAANQAVQQGIPGAEKLGDIIGDMAKSCLNSSSELRKMAAEERALERQNARTKRSIDEINDILDDFETGGKAAVGASNDLAKELRKIADDKAAVKTLKNTTEGTKEWQKAVDKLSESGFDTSQITGDLASVEQAIADDENAFANLLNTIAASAGVTFNPDTSQFVSIQGDADATAAKVANVLNWLRNLDGAGFSMEGNTIKTVIPNASVRRSSGGGGGGGGKKNSALEKEIALIEHKKSLDQLTYQQEIDLYEKALKKYAKTTDEKRELTVKLYELRKQKFENDLDYKKAMDKLTLGEEIKALEAELKEYKKGTEARRELETKLYSLKKDLARQEYDLKVYYGQLTLEQQENELKRMISKYKEGTEARIELEKELYDVQQQIRDANIEKLDRLTDGIITALENRYEEQRKAEEDRIKESIDNWRQWGEDQKAAIQEQIDALDDLTKEEDRADEEKQKRRKIAALEQQMQYEQDEYNRKKLQEQLTKAQDDLNKWLTRNAREDLKEALRDQMGAIDDKVEAEQDKLKDQLDASNAYYEDLMDQQKLQAEAQKILMNSSQQEIIDLLKAYAPDYNATGKSLGEQLVDGFTAKVGDIEAWFDTFVQNMTSKITTKQNQLAGIATTAADKFTKNNTAQSNSAAAAQKTAEEKNYNIQLIFNEPVDSPVEVKREMERLIEQLSNL